MVRTNACSLTQSANEISGLAQCALVLEHWIPWFRSPRGKALGLRRLLFGRTIVAPNASHSGLTLFPELRETGGSFTFHGFAALCCILVVKAPPDEIQGNHDCDLIVTEDAARFSDRAHLAVKLLAACAQPVFIFGFDPEVKDPIHDIQRKI